MPVDDEHHRLGLIQLPPNVIPRTPLSVGLSHSAYTYHDLGSSLAELQIDNMSPEEATAYLNGPEYRQDAIGPSFDPDIMLAALQSGVPAAELTIRDWARTCPQINVAERLMT